MIRLLPLLLLLFVSFAVDAQQRKTLKGKIVADSLNGTAINIVNLSSKTGTTNDSAGNFEIEVQPADTLFFSSIQYDLKEIIISEKMLINSILNVHLVHRVNQLEEVNISNISLSGNLNNDLAGIEVFDQEAVGFVLSTRPKPTIIQRKMSSATGSPLLFLINTLNGRLKMLKKAQKIMEYENWIDIGLDVLPADFFTNDLQIPEGKARQFIYFCAEDPSFVTLLKDGDALMIIENYLEKAPLFIALHKTEENLNEH